MIIQPTDSRRDAIRLATCAARLNRPLSDYDQQTVPETIERGNSPALRPRGLDLHKPVNPFNQSLKPEMMKLNEWDFIKSLKTVVIDDHSTSPVVYALIPSNIVSSMSDIDFHSLLESLANNEQLKDHIRKSCGYDCGLVFFMIDESDNQHSIPSKEPMGIDFQRFQAEPDKDKLVMLGATGANAITPPEVQELARSNFADRLCLVGTDLRRIVPQSSKASKYIVTESTPLLSCFPDQRNALRQLLNGKAIVDEIDNPKNELKTMIEDGDIESPRTGDRLSTLLLDRTAPSVVDEAGYYTYNPKAKTFIDRRVTDEFDSGSDMERQFYKEQLELRSPYPVRGLRVEERESL